jgi:hypothetical protein
LFWGRLPFWDVDCTSLVRGSCDKEGWFGGSVDKGWVMRGKVGLGLGLGYRGNGVARVGAGVVGG